MSVINNKTIYLSEYSIFLRKKQFLIWILLLIFLPFLLSASLKFFFFSSSFSFSSSSSSSLKFFAVFSFHPFLSLIYTRQQEGELKKSAEIYDFFTLGAEFESNLTFAIGGEERALVLRDGCSFFIT